MLSPTNGTATGAVDPGQFGFVFGTDDRYVCMLQSKRNSTVNEDFFVTFYDRVDDKYSSRLFRVADSSSTVEWGITPIYKTSPDGNKVATVVAEVANGRFPPLVFDASSGAVDTFTINGESGGIDSLLILTDHRTTNGGDWNLSTDCRYIHWESNDAYWFFHSFDTSNLLRSYRFDLSDYSSNATNTTVSNIQNFRERTIFMLSTDAGNVLVQDYVGDIFLYKPETNGNLTLLASASSGGTGGSYRALVKHSATKYSALNGKMAGVTPTNATEITEITLDETPSSESVSVTDRTVIWDALSRTVNRTLFVLFQTEDSVVLSDLTDVTFPYHKLPMDSNGLLENQLETLPVNRQSFRQSSDLSNERYVDFQSAVSNTDYMDGMLITSVPVNQQLEILEGTRVPDVYLGTCLSVTTDEVEVAVDVDLVANNGQKDQSFGKFSYVNGDYLVPVFSAVYDERETQLVGAPQATESPHVINLSTGSVFAFEDERRLEFSFYGIGSSVTVAMDGEFYFLNTFGPSNTRTDVEIKTNGKATMAGAIAGTSSFVMRSK